ncbi:MULTISPECIES: hypothetical protein [unclassified Microcoleus]|uniref:hypothetical protein n=1 Tax=unclassified Microcoleus TaxID=2642155 RepID=UPI002FD3F0AF
MSHESLVISEFGRSPRSPFSFFRLPSDFHPLYQFRLHRNDIEDTAVPCPYN